MVFLLIVIVMLINQRLGTLIVETQSNDAKLSAEVSELVSDISHLRRVDDVVEGRLNKFEERLDNHVNNKEYVVVNFSENEWVTDFNDDGEPIFWTFRDEWTGRENAPKLFTYRIADGLSTLYEGRVEKYGELKI